MSIESFRTTCNAHPTLEMAVCPVASSAFRLMGTSFLLVIDAYSKWLEVRIMPSTHSSAIVATLRTLFAQFGLPATIVTDNAPNFSSAEFNARNGISHLYSPPYHPSSNGLAERAVQSFKQSMKKLKGGSLSDRVAHVLFHSHTTPTSTVGLTPAELLQNRRLRTRLDLLRPSIATRVVDKQAKQQHNANLHSKNREFKEGEEVYVKNFHSGPKWMPGHVTKLLGNVSVEATLFDGRSVTRHLDHIRRRIITEASMDLETIQQDPPDTSVQRSDTSVQRSDTSVQRSDTSVQRPDTSVQCSDTPLVDTSVELTTGTSCGLSHNEGSEATPHTARYPSRPGRPPDRFSPTLT